MTEVPIPYSERLGRSKLSVVRDGSVFLHSIVWTALTYNPVRILGLLGLAGIGLTAVIGLNLLIARLGGQTTLSSWQVASLFVALVSGVVGVSLFSLGVTFNYLVSLFYQRPIRQGLFGKPLFKRPLDKQFWWMGGLVMLAGIGLGVGSFVLGLNGWVIDRLWLYLLGSAMLILIGMQLIIYWVLLRVLDELSRRNALTSLDLNLS